jgi:hypothetical protein
LHEHQIGREFTNAAADPAKVSIKRSAPIEVAIHNGTENNVRGFDQLELLTKDQSPLWQTQILSALPFNSP